MRKVKPKLLKSKQEDLLKTIGVNPNSVTNLKNKMNVLKYRTSFLDVFVGKGVLKICSKFTGEHPCQSVISIKLLCF